MLTHELTTIPAGDLRQSLFIAYLSDLDRAETTARAYMVNIRQFIAWLNYTGTTRPTREDIITYRQFLTAEHDAIMLDPDSPAGWRYRTDAHGVPIKVQCKAATVKQYLQSVKQFFTWTEAGGYYPNIAKSVRAPKIRTDTHKREALTAADVLTIENSITHTAKAKAAAAADSQKDTAGRICRATEQGKRLKALYLLAVTAGLRVIELQRASVKDLELINGCAFIWIHGKGHSEADERKPLARPVYDAIQDYLNTRHEAPTANSPLFVATGNRSGGQRLATTTISTMLKRAMQSAGYDSERITAHSLRHTAGTTAHELTGNLYLTQRYMRHADPATTEIYLHVDTERQETELAEKIYTAYHAPLSAENTQGGGTGRGANL